MSARSTYSRRLRIVLWSTLLAVPVCVALAGPLLVGSAPTRSQVPFGPSTWSPFGTDRMGRDVLATALVGGRTLLLTTLATVGAAYGVGFVLGVAAASSARHWVEDLVMRPVDVLLCLPSLVLVMVVGIRTDGAAVAVAIATAITLVAPITRFVRMAARGVVHGPVMEALRLQGAGWGRRQAYVARALARPVAGDLGVRVTSAVYVLAAANFLGIGLESTSTDWAVTVAANKDGLLVSSWSVLLPAGLIVSLVLGVNLLWDELLGDPSTRAEQRSERARCRVGEVPE